MTNLLLKHRQPVFLSYTTLSLSEITATITSTSVTITVNFWTICLNIGMTGKPTAQRVAHNYSKITADKMTIFQRFFG